MESEIQIPVVVGNGMHRKAVFMIGVEHKPGRIPKLVAIGIQVMTSDVLRRVGICKAWIILPEEISSAVVVSYRSRVGGAVYRTEDRHSNRPTQRTDSDGFIRPHFISGGVETHSSDFVFKRCHRVETCEENIDAARIVRTDVVFFGI